MRISKNGIKYRGITLKKCNYCGIQFEALKQKTQFCSISCANKSRKSEYIRNCPSCGKILKYNSSGGYCSSKNKNKKCVSCAVKESMNNPVIKQKVIDKLRIKRITIENKCKYCNMLFKQEIKINQKNIKKFCSSHCRILYVNKSELKRKNTRLTIIKNLEQNKNNGNQIVPFYNKNSIPILEQKAVELGITDLQHAENGGEFYIKELGYWADGYSLSKNIIIEYYENWHKNRKERDEKRKKEIINFLKCEFYEIKEWEIKNDFNI